MAAASFFTPMTSNPFASGALTKLPPVTQTAPSTSNYTFVKPALNTGTSYFTPAAPFVPTPQPAAPAPAPAPDSRAGVLSGLSAGAGAQQPTTITPAAAPPPAKTPGLNTSIQQNQQSWATPASSAATNQLMQPGVAEQWYAQNGYLFNGSPQALTNYYNSVAPLLNGRQQLGAVNGQQQYNQMQGVLGGQSYGQGVQQNVIGQLGQASQGENYINQAAYGLSGPNMSAQYSQQALRNPYFTNPTATAQYAKSQAPILNQTGVGTQGAYNDSYGINNLANSSYFQGPTDSSLYYQQHAGDLNYKGQGELGAYNAQDSINDLSGNAAFTQAGSLENYAKTAVPGLAQQGQGEQAAHSALGATNWGNISPELAAQNYGDRNLAYTQGATSGNNRLSSLYANAGDLGSQNYAGQQLNYFQPQLQAKSNSENLYDSGNQGLDKFYALQQQKGQEAIERQMAATGTFTSGDTAKAMYGLTSELGASQARDMASLAQQADQAQLARAGQLNTMANSTSAEALARRSQLAGEAQGADQIGLSNIGANQSAYNMASNEGISKMQQKLAGQNTALGAVDRNIATDQLGLQRTQEGANIANQADQFGQTRLMNSATLQGQAAGLGLQGQNAGMQRLQTGSQMANAADNTTLAALMGRSNLYDQAGALGLQADAQDINRIGMGNTVNQSVDASTLAQLLGGNTIASTGSQQQIAQLQALAQAGNMQASQQLARLQEQSQAGSAYDDSQLARQQALFDASNNVDTSNRAGYQANLQGIQAGANMTGQMDQNTQTSLNNAFNAANQTQTQATNRLRDSYLDPLSLAQAMSGNQMNASGQNQQASAADTQQMISLLMAQYGMSASEAQQKANEWSSTGQFMTQLAIMQAMPKKA